jgi:hypothetical protein
MTPLGWWCHGFFVWALFVLAPVLGGLTVAEMW